MMFRVHHLSSGTKSCVRRMDMYTNDPREKTHVKYTSEGNLGSNMWIGTSIIHVKNTSAKHVKQNQVTFFTLYPSEIHVNWYTINPRETIHVEYT